MKRASALLAALAVSLTASTPAFAAEEDATYDMRATLEYQSWGWGAATGARLDYATPMTVFTVMDHSGAVFGATRTVAANEARRREAEREAIRKDQRSYTYEVEEARAAEGTRFGFSVGQAGILGATATNPAATGSVVPNISGATTTTRFAKIHLEGDIVALGGGVFVFDSGVAYWSALALPPGVTYTPANTGNLMYIEAWNWPLGVRYRYSPAFLPGLTVEPSVNFDWLVTLANGVNGKWGFDARNFGVEVGYQILPPVKLRAGYFINRLAHNAVPWMKNEEMVDMRNATVGATLFF
jgi:hypothetical protein